MHMMQTNLANELYHSSQATKARDQMGVGNKFIAPLIANGKVYAATLNGVEVFGALPPTDWHPESLSFLERFFPLPASRIGRHCFASGPFRFFQTVEADKLFTGRPPPVPTR